MFIKQLLILFFLAQVLFPQNYFPHKIRNKDNESTSEFNTMNWTVRHLLTGYRIYDFIKDSDGFMWIATNKGLIRYDGSSIEIFDEQNVKEIQGGIISELVISAYNNLIFFNGFDILRKDKKNKFNLLKTGNNNFLQLSSMKMDSAGTLWVGTLRNGLFKIVNNKIFKVTIKSKNDLQRITHLYFDNKNRLWISIAGKGLYLYNNEKIEVFPWNEKLPSKNIRAVFFDSENRLWAATNKGVVVIKNYDDNKNYTYKFISKEIIQSFAEDENRNIWMGSTQKGIFIFKDYRVIKFYSDVKLTDYSISKIGIYGKEIWIGTLKGGINLIRSSSISSIGENNGLDEDYVNSVFEDDDGSVLIGTRSGLYKLEKPLQANNVKKLNILKGQHIYAIAKTNNNELLFGTRYNGLFIIKNNFIKNYTVKDGLKSNFIRCLFVDDDNSIWIGTNAGGVSILKNGRINKLKTKTELTNDLISFIHKSRDGKYWIGTSGGGVNIIDINGNVNFYNKKNGLHGNIISSMAEEDNGSIWLGINGGGLALIKDSKIIPFTTENGLYTNTILNVLFDNRNDIWCSTPYGIFKVLRQSIDNYINGDAKEIKYRNFDESDGMISDKCTGASPQTASVTRKGVLLFSTMYGLVQVDPASLVEETHKVSIYIDRIIINNSKYNPEDVNTIGPNPERIEFSFGSIDFKNPSKVYYKYKLIDFDNNWIDLKGNKNIVYTHLPYGKYKLIITAYDKGNKKDLVSIEKGIVIIPYFWQTLIFRIFAFTVFVFLMIAITKYILKKKYKRKLQMIEAEHALENERMRISRDMHDEFGSSLSKINLLTEIAKQNISNKLKTNEIIKEISLSGRNLAESIDEIVWAVNPQNDRLDKMLYYLTSFFENHLALTDIQFKYEIPDEIPDEFISAEFRHNLFCVLKEGINNSLKHSGATLIRLIFEYDMPVLKVLLIDNGKGIDNSKISEFRNGIKNMTKRIDSLGGNLEISNDETGGVKIAIQLTLKMTRK